VTLVRTDVSEELIASIIRVEGIGELRTLALLSSETSVLTRSTLGPIREGGFFDYGVVDIADGDMGGLRMSRHPVSQVGEELIGVVTMRARNDVRGRIMHLSIPLPVWAPMWKRVSLSPSSC
jgi:hypothetical protein